ncbi:MAG: hypothetical protein AB1458_02330 [Bacteroidota bacterium]
MRHNEVILFFSTIFGLLAVLVGAVGLYADFGGWTLYDTESAAAIKAWMGQAGLILGELLIGLVFAISTILALVVARQTATLKGTMMTLGFARLALSALLFASFYGKGWYFILDPNGNSLYAYLVLLFGALQGFSLFLGRKE